MATNGSQNIVTAATGKILQGAGVGTAPSYSTATYPTTASSAGKILRADGTNWAATTATYPDTAGTSGNVLTSDGTNWVSSAPAAGTNLFSSIGTFTGNPFDGLTYYFVQNSAFTVNTAFTIQGIYLIPYACTITKAYGQFTIAGTLGSSENCTLFLRVNNTTNTNISTTIQLTSATVSVNNTGLSISLSAGDTLVWGFTGPTWATNPTTVNFYGTFST